MRPYGIRQYVGLLTLVPMFVLALVLETYFLLHHFRTLDQEMLEKGELVIHQLASSSEYGVFSNNMAFLQSTAASALQRADVTGVLILDVNSRILASAGDFSRAFRSEIIERSTANRLQFAHAGDAGDTVVLHPAAGDVHDLWLYRAIIPEQLAFDDFSGHAIKPVSTGSVILEISMTRHEKYKSLMLWTTLIVTLAFLAVTSYLVNIASRKITRPIRKLSQVVEAIGAGRLDTRVDPETGVCELATLARGLNLTTEHLEREQEVLQERIEEATLALRARQEEAERASQDKSRFLAVASHDLRQPLHALGLYVAELQNKLSGTPQQRLAEQIENSVESLSLLLNALLDISKLDAGAVVPQIRVCGMDAILERIAADYQMLASLKNICLAVRPCGAFTISDPLLLERILANLVSNAVRYTPQNGSVLVACRRRGNSLRIEVRDNGVGISKADQENIFREFIQLAQPQLDTSKGLGLGLAIVDRLARLLGHRIELRSSPGRGAVFALEVPLAVRPGGQLGDGAARADGQRSHGAESREAKAGDIQMGTQPLAGKRMLVVDDDADVLSGTASAIASWGCRVSTAASVAEVEQLIREGGEWDFVVSDYQLENETNGLDVIARVRDHQQRPVPCLLISGDTSPALLKLASVSGHHLLHKPVRPAKLRSMIVHLLGSGGHDGDA